MRIKLASALIIMGLLASSMAPASAIFGLSKCEKAKSQITSLENKMSKYLNNVRGYDCKLQGHNYYQQLK